MEADDDSDIDQEQEAEEAETEELQADRDDDDEEEDEVEGTASEQSVSPSNSEKKGSRRGRSRSPRGKAKKKKKKSGKKSKSPKAGKRSKSKSPKGSKSPSGRKKSKSRSKSPKSSKSGSTKASGKKKKKKKGSGGGKAARKASINGVTGRQELQAALDRAVYEARIQDLERQLARARKERAEAVQVTSEEDQVHDFVGKELQVELEALQNSFQEMLTKEAEERRIRKKQDARTRDEMHRQAEGLRVAQAEVEELKQKLAENRDMWEDAQLMLAERDRLIKENKELRDLMREREDQIRDYESRFTLIHRATMKATSKRGRTVTTIGGATGLIPVLLEGMKMFPHDRVLQREVCLLITHIAFTPEDYIILAEFEGLELILKALQNHRSSRPLVASCLRMLWKFSTASQELRDRVRGYDCLSLVLRFLAIIPHGAVRRMQFFGGRLISYLLPEHISTRCPLDLVAEEHAIATGNHHTRRASDTVLPFLTGTQTLNATYNPDDTRRSSIIMTMGATRMPNSPQAQQPGPPVKEGLEVLPGAKGETGRLTLTSRELIKILLTCVTWLMLELVEYDTEAARRLRERKEEEERGMEGAAVNTQRSPPQHQHQLRESLAASRGPDPEEEEGEEGLWRPNTGLAKKMMGDTLGAIIATIDAPDDSSGCRRLLFSEPSLAILVQAWRSHFDISEVVLACCMIVRNSLVVEPQRRAEQLAFLKNVGLDKVLKASERRHKGNSKVLSELVTLSRIFFVEVVY